MYHPVLIDGCPNGHGELLTVTATQGVLFRHGGYGGPLRTTWRMCPSCRWSTEAARDTANPRGW